MKEVDTISLSLPLLLHFSLVFLAPHHSLFSLQNDGFIQFRRDFEEPSDRFIFWYFCFVHFHNSICLLVDFPVRFFFPGWVSESFYCFSCVKPSVFVIPYFLDLQTSFMKPSFAKKESICCGAVVELGLHSFVPDFV